MNKHITDGKGILSEDGCLVILYESPAAREQAIGFCEKVAKQSDATVEAAVRCFSFDSLCIPAKAAQALKSALAAELIIFAVSATGDLPREIKIWAEDLLQSRGEREGAVVGLVLNDAANPCDIACLKEVYLRHLAHRAGMDYLSHVPALIPKAIPDSVESFNQRAERVTSLLDEILHTRFVPSSMPLK